MSNSRHLNNEGSTIGFRYHTSDEELEEIQLPIMDKSENKNPEEDLVTENIDNLKLAADSTETINSAVREQRNVFGKRSISVDSVYESPFANPIETWKKLNVLKEKITKTVEEKLLDMKSERNVLSKSSHNRLMQSKENSSISDSEDTSESSKELYKDAESHISDIEKSFNENPDNLVEAVNNESLAKEKQETKTRKNNYGFKNFKNLMSHSEINNVQDIKIATETKEGSVMDSSIIDDVESGVEAEENLDATEEESIDFFDGETLSGGTGGSPNPPSGGTTFAAILSYSSLIYYPKSNTFLFFLGMTLYLFFPLSEFFRGFLLSLMLIVFWGSVKSFVHLDDISQQQRPFAIPDYKSMPPLKVPVCKSVKGIWFNEYENDNYDPDYYSVTQTVPAYLELNENILKVSRPKGKIRRRATYDEPEYKLQMISQRIYNIRGCNVYLMPEGLTRKRLFSKKYPIVIFLKPDSLVSEKHTKNDKSTDEKDLQVETETEDSLPTCPKQSKSKSALYFFARCDRQKEEWYRKLLRASRIHLATHHKNETILETTEEAEGESDKILLDSSPIKEASTPFENLYFDDEVAQIEEYLQYMSKFVDEDFRNAVHVKPQSSWSKKLKNKKKDLPGQEVLVESLRMKYTTMTHFKKNKISKASNSIEVNEDYVQEDSHTSNQVQWFNAFINRILFDVFRSPYWLKKIQDKVQKKLNSIRLPYYVEDIEVIEMDLGKTGPMFHRASQPYIDERGLWFDMDVTFEGLIKLTIQTHLNLVKLQKGIEENEETGTSVNDKLKKEKIKQKVGKESILVKESQNKSKEFVVEKNQEGKSFRKPCQEQKKSQDDPDSQPDLSEQKFNCKSSENCKCKLIDEVAKLAEIVVEESLFGSEEKNEKIYGDCLCSESEKNRSPIYDSELEDSAESSDEDQEEETEEVQQPAKLSPTDENPPPFTPKRYPKNRRSSKKIFQVFENVAQSKYFRSVAQTKYIQKAIAGVSAAKLRLTLEIKSCVGILAINIPPPPSDRFWYGFREMPVLVFSANPKIGDKAVRFVQIRNYLQKKILHELKKVMVVPNMIDFVLPTTPPPARSLSSLQIGDTDLQEASTPYELSCAGRG